MLNCDFQNRIFKIHILKTHFLKNALFQTANPNPPLMVIVSVVYDATSSINAKLSSVISMIKIGDGVMQDLMTSLLFLEHSQLVSNNISTLAIQKPFFFFTLPIIF